MARAGAPTIGMEPFLLRNKHLIHAPGSPCRSKPCPKMSLSDHVILIVLFSSCYSHHVILIMLFAGINCLFGPKRNLETLRLMKDALDR